MANPRVVILMGSDSDWEVMASCWDQLKALGIPADFQVKSAHRTPEAVHAFAKSAEDSGVEIIIAGAGMSAALAGTVAACTTLPVIGVPLASGTLGGIDALLSTVQMPPGVPVAAVGIGKAGAQNAAILAAQILALKDPTIAEAVKKFKSSQTASVDNKNQALRERVFGG